MALVLIALSVAGEAYAQKGISYDIAGVYTSRNRDGNDKGAWGPGIGVNYDFTPNIGVGVDTYSDGFRLPYMLNASFIYTFHTTWMLNPYGFAGFGRQWEHASQWTEHVGAGVEYETKFGPGLFVDGRWVFANETANYGAIRFGVRVRF